MAKFVICLWKSDRSKRFLHVDDYEEAVRKLETNVKVPDVTRAVIYRQHEKKRSAVKIWTNPDI